MTKADALLQAKECERLARLSGDPEKRTIALELRQLWIELAYSGFEIDQLIAASKLDALHQEICELVTKPRTMTPYAIPGSPLTPKARKTKTRTDKRSTQAKFRIEQGAS
jgi:hypothetical protein